MNSARRIAAVVLTAALSFGAVGFAASPAEAVRDTTWPTVVAPDSTTPSLADTTWPTVVTPRATTNKLADTTWPS